MHLTSVKFLPDTFPTIESYPFCLKIFQQSDRINFTAPVTFFTGENGAGKSTLLRAISRRCGIHIWDGVDRPRYIRNRYEKDLYKFISVEWADGVVPGSFFGSEIFRNFTQNLDEWAKADPGMLDYFGGESLMTKSHGQSIISFFKARYSIKGLYLLDEPETALSPASQMELLRVITKQSRKGHAQFIIASHSPILLACPDASLLSFNHTPIELIKYEDTEYYRFYKDFLNNREKYLEEI